MHYSARGLPGPRSDLVVIGDGKAPSRSSTRDLAELLQRATGLHQRGQLADAERGYRQILNAKRDHAEARHFLGILRFQQGRGTATSAIHVT